MVNDNIAIQPVEEEWVIINPSLITGSPQGLTAQQARLWSLVLTARFVPCQLLEKPDIWQLLVPPERFIEACNELRSFEHENRDWPPSPPPPRPLAENRLATLSVLVLLATFYNITHLDIPDITGNQIQWLACGSANAARILEGEWWRLVTALTLHSDVVHLLSNLSIGGIFVLLLCRELGSGLAWTLLLAAGAGGNALNAYVQPTSHVSVGASTAVFGAVGILAALSFVRQHSHRQLRWALPIAAAMALLAILGTEGKQTDLGAHLFGFVSGILLGLMTERLIDRYGQPGASMNALLAVFSVVVVMVAWLVAVAAG